MPLPVAPWWSRLWARLWARLFPPAAAPPPPVVELIPPDWQAIEPRWDCQVCRGIQAAEILPDGFRCLHCNTTTVTTYEVGVS
jgi:hypothetical protein